MPSPLPNHIRATRRGGANVCPELSLVAVLVTISTPGHLSRPAGLRHQRALHESSKHRGAIGNRVIVEIVAVVVDRCTCLAVAEVDIGTWHLLQHKGEILRGWG